MKTYIMTIPEILKGISNSLDITATFCNKGWIVFNDEGVRLLFIFQDDGALIVSRNGVVSKQKWSFIKANSTLLIEDEKQAFLLHPVFIDNVIFALQQDGTQHHLFMIDENKEKELQLLTYQSVIKYFKTKEESVKANPIKIEAPIVDVEHPKSNNELLTRKEQREKSQPPD